MNPSMVIDFNNINVKKKVYEDLNKKPEVELTQNELKTSRVQGEEL